MSISSSDPGASSGTSCSCTRHHDSQAVVALVLRVISADLFEAFEELVLSFDPLKVAEYPKSKERLDHISLRGSERS